MSTCDRITSVGTFKPRKLHHVFETQWAEFARTHAPHGLYLYGQPELRGPNMWGGIDDAVTVWHHDLNERFWAHTWLMVWSDMRPTEIKHVSDVGSVVVPEPYEVVLFKNDRWMHRQPALSKRENKRRHFGRAWFTQDEKMALSYLTHDFEVEL